MSGNGEASCTHQRVTVDTRTDNDVIPPIGEERLRCLDCGWQGKWQRSDREQPSE